MAQAAFRTFSKIGLRLWRLHYKTLDNSITRSERESRVCLNICADRKWEFRVLELFMHLVSVIVSVPKVALVVHMKA